METLLNNSLIEIALNNSILRDIFLLIFGTFLGTLLSLSTTYFNKRLEEHKDKKITASVIMSEVKENQKKLLPKSSLYKHHGHEINSIIIDLRDTKLSPQVFDNYIFAAYINKIGLLPVNIRSNILEYYSKIRNLENMSESLTSEPANQVENEIKRDLTLKWFKEANEIYELGEELADYLEILYKFQ